MKDSRAIIDPLTLCLVGFLALGGGAFLTNWHPLDAFKSKPPTAELAKAQADLAKAQAEAEQARKEKDVAVAAERAKTDAEARAIQQDNVGTVAALNKISPEHLDAAAKLGRAMALREQVKFVALLGKLPDAQQEAMITLVEEALSGKQSEIDESNRKLAQRDADFKTLAGERDTLKAQIPVLENKAAGAEQKAIAVQGEVTVKTNEVAKIADTLDAEKRKSGSLAGALSSARNVVLWAIGIWVFLAYVLPGLIKHMNPANPMKAVLRNISGYVTAPLLFSDAKAKLKELADKIEAPKT